jgi:hypothetical protein
MRRAALVLGLVAAVLTLRMIPVTPARADVCSLPVVGTVCSVLSGVTDGVSWTVDSATGVIKDAAGKVIAKLGSKLAAAGCVAGSGALTDGIGGVALAGICKAASEKLLGLLGGKKSPPTSSGAAGVSPPSEAGGESTASDPPDSPANYLSTSALAAGAAVFLGTITSEIGKATAVDVTGGWFRSAYGQAVAFASGLMLIAFLLACLEGSVRSDSAMLLLALQALPRAAILGGAAAVLIGMGIAFTDQAGIAVAGPNMGSATHALHVLALVFVALGLAAKGAGCFGAWDVRVDPWGTRRVVRGVRVLGVVGDGA